MKACRLAEEKGMATVRLAGRRAGAREDERPHGPYLIGAWTFGDRGSLERAVDAGAIDEVSVDWLQSRADGSVEAPKADASFIAEARKQDCRVIVTLTDYNEAIPQFDPAIPAAILATAETRRRHVAAVADWCRDNDVDGVDVDWEAVTAEQRNGYATFVEELARRLHRDGRLIAVDVYPKTREPGAWDGPRAQDWRRLGRAVDQFRVMTYNYSGSWSGPGPLSPPEWMDRVLDFAETQVKPRKIVMGVDFYGRDWRGAQTTDLVWADVGRIRSADKPRASRGPSAELMLSYSHDGARHTAVFPGRQGDRRQAADAPRAASPHPRRVLLDHGPGRPRGLEGAAQTPALTRLPETDDGVIGRARHASGGSPSQ